MRYVLWAAVIAALFIALVTALFFIPEDKVPEPTPQIVYVEVTPEPNTIIIPAPEGFNGDLDNLWVAITVPGMEEANSND